MDHPIALTGGPGSGKTTVINCLQALGYATTPEVGRRIIQAQIESNGSALPWQDKTAFRDLMLQAEIKHYESSVSQTPPVFCDRGVIDVYGYSLLEQLTLTTPLIQSCQQLQYHHRVFIFPPWASIFMNDAERQQDFSEAVATYDAMISAYHTFGYELIDVPQQSPDQRVRFILDTLKSA